MVPGATAVILAEEAGVETVEVDVMVVIQTSARSAWKTTIASVIDSSAG
jgi:hypothetical protein